MRISSVALIFVSVALSSSSQIILKRGMMAQDVQRVMDTGRLAKIVLTILTSSIVLGGLACFGLSALLWLFVLSRVSLSSAYPFVALGIFVTVVAGSLLFGEPISTTKTIGVGLIISGVLLVGLGG